MRKTPPQKKQSIHLFFHVLWYIKNGPMSTRTDSGISRTKASLAIYCASQHSPVQADINLLAAPDTALLLGVPWSCSLTQQSFKKCLTFPNQESVGTQNSEHLWIRITTSKCITKPLTLVMWQIKVSWSFHEWQSVQIGTFVPFAPCSFQDEAWNRLSVVAQVSQCKPGQVNSNDCHSGFLPQLSWANRLCSCFCCFFSPFWPAYGMNGKDDAIAYIVACHTCIMYGNDIFSSDPSREEGYKITHLLWHSHRFTCGEQRTTDVCDLWKALRPTSVQL